MQSLTLGSGNGTTFVSVSMGSQHACAVAADYTVRCWGLDQYGSLGYNGAVESIGNKASG